MLPSINELVQNSNRLHEVITKVVELVTHLLDSDMAGVLLYNQETDELVLQKPAFRLADDNILNSFRFPLRGGGNAVTVYITGKPYITNDSRRDSRILQKYVMLSGAKNTITVPLEVGNRRIGVLHVDNKRNGEFTQQDLEILTFLASHLAIFIENTILYERERKQAEQLALLNAKLQKQQRELEKLITMKDHLKNEAEAQYRGEFLDGLFSGKDEIMDQVFQQAEFFRYDLGTRSRVAVISVNEKMLLEANPIENRHTMLSSLDLRSLISSIQKLIPGSLAVGRRNRVEFLMPVAPRMRRENLNQKLSEVCQWGRRSYPGKHISMGVGCECHDFKDYRKSYQQALKALDIGTALDGGNDIVFYDQLGVYSLLIEINDVNMLREFVEDRIGPLLYHDQKKNSSLVETLDKYLKSGGSLKETARLLYVHVATVKYRLSRIQELLPIDLRKTENHFDLQLALYVLRIIEKNSADKTRRNTYPVGYFSEKLQKTNV